MELENRKRMDGQMTQKKSKNQERKKTENKEFMTIVLPCECVKD